MKERYEHREAFCLMTYRGELTGRTELLWNSRDGVTPFIIPSADREESMTHVDFASDRRVPTYVPAIGMRVFVTMTRERAAEHARRIVERDWASMREHFGSHDRAIAVIERSCYGEDGMEGCSPDIIVVDEAFRARCQAAFDEALKRGRP